MAFASLLSWLFEPIILGTVSFVLVAVGLWMVLQDFVRDRRSLSTLFSKAPANSAAVSRTPPSPAVAGSVPVTTRTPAVEQTAAAPSPPPPPANAPQPLQAFPLLSQAIADIRGELATDDDDDTAPRDVSMEISWRALAPRIDRLMADVGPAVRLVGITLSPPGEPRWALGNRAYGTYRRVNLDGESVAWLRSEITTDGQLRFRLRSHEPSLSTLNADCACRLGRLNSPELSHVLTVTLLPVTRYAAWLDARQSKPAFGSAPLAEVIGRAIEIANGALVEARAAFRLNQRPDASDRDAARHVLDVLVDDRQIARLHLDQVGEHIEVSVGVPDPHRLDLARRQKLPAERLAAYELAEAMVTCSWPALAHALGTGVPSSPVAGRH